ncbi:MAG: PAS domain-containing protein [Sulfurimonas sp.]|nr:PAS domain-containing protein [Sulfurimonas sp.]
MKLKNKLFFTYLALFALLFSFGFILNSIYKNILIDDELKDSLLTLETNFSIATHYDELYAKSAYSFVQKNPQINNILVQALQGTPQEKSLLRKELYTYMQKPYDSMRIRGIEELQFILPDASSFLKINETQKDTKILKELDESNNSKGANKHSNTLHSSPSFYLLKKTFPIRDENDNFLGSFEVSFSLESIQENLTKINKTQTYFLHKKEENFYIDALLNEPQITDEIKDIFIRNKQNIHAKMQREETFTLYDETQNGVYAFSFLPIKKVHRSNTFSYIVSFAQNKDIDNILLGFRAINLTAFIALVIIFYLSYRQALIKRDLLETSKQQAELLSLFNKGEITLFKWKNNDNWDVEYVSRNVQRTSGYSRGEFLNAQVSYVSLIHPDDVQTVFEEVQNAIQRGLETFVHHPYRLKRKDGEYRWILDTSYLIKDEEQNITHFLGYILDITSSKEQELELRESQKNLNEAQTDAKIGSYYLNLSTNTLKWSQEHYKIMKKDPRTYTPCVEDVLSYIHKDDQKFVQEQLEETLKTLKRNEFEYRFVFEDETIHVHATSQISKISEDGKALEMTGTVQNVTATKLLEIQLKELNENLSHEVDKQTGEIIKKDKILQEQSKLAAMGEMVGAIAHQWRQPLNSLNINIQNLDDDYHDGLITKEFIDNFIQKQSKTIRFMSNTIDDFRNFFRIDKITKKFSVKEAVNATISIQEAQLKNHNILVHIAGDDFKIHTLQSEFSQVLLNLITNAKDAIVENNVAHGEINITLSKDKLTIADNGGGVSPEILERIFEPYFTTKPQGKGTGMGLYMSKMIIEQNIGATLSAHNMEKGLCFVIAFETPSA